MCLVDVLKQIFTKKTPLESAAPIAVLQARSCTFLVDVNVVLVETELFGVFICSYWKNRVKHPGNIDSTVRLQRSDIGTSPTCLQLLFNYASEIY